MMFASFLVGSIAFIALVTSTNAFHEIFPGAYCAPESSLVTQPGTYASPAACSTQCSAFSFFSYVPSSQQCLCTNSCSSPVNNPGANSYAQDTVHPTTRPTAHPTAHPTNAPTAFCEVPGVYCGPYSNLHTQPGTFATPAACGAQCAAASSSFHFYSYVPSSEQCLCATTCDPAQYIVNPNVNSFCIQPSYTLCADNKFCVNGVLQPGFYATPQLCADKCVADNKGYTFFNYDPSFDTCACSVGCVGPDYLPTVNVYAIDGQSCTYEQYRLRRD